MNLNPPPRFKDAHELQEWLEGLYQFLQYPVFSVIKLNPRSAAPTTEEGQLYYDSDTDNLLLRDDTAWGEVATDIRFIIRRVSQAAQPTPATGELLLWRDTDDDKTYLVYTDTDVGARKVELT